MMHFMPFLVRDFVFYRKNDGNNATASGRFVSALINDVTAHYVSAHQCAHQYMH